MTVSTDLAISLDGFVAGADQSEENPLGVGGERLHTGCATNQKPTPM